MCGIAGYVAPAGESPSRALLQRMCDVIHHRGPDSDGYRIDGPVALGMRRLKIIDLATGDQPIGDERGERWVVFNGEIYNYLELRERLLAQGHVLKTRGDTETIVHLYEDAGPACVDQLRGMFAFALWDGPRQSLLLARDRVGVKPLYYAPLAGGGLVFASELKALFQHPAVARRMDPVAIDALLAFRCVPEPLTGFEGIYKLPAGCILRWRAGAYEVSRYWDLEPEPEPERDAGAARRTDDEWADELLERLREAVRIRLMSEVPLGAFLSGGIDSSTVVALMAEASARPVQTFSIGFPGTGRSELPHARAVARMFGTDHHEFEVEPQQVEQLMPELVWHFDEPFGDSSALPMYLLSRLARSSVTVVLTGDGGDEAFAGYTSFRGEAFSQIYGRLPAPLGRWAVPAITRAAARFAPPALAARAERARHVIELAQLDFLDRAYRRGQYFSDAERARLLRPTQACGHGRDMMAAVDARGGRTAPLDRVAFLSSRMYLPNDILTKVDRMTMAHSLEARGPLLDHRLAQWAAGVPMRLKLRRGQTKYLLKRVAARYLPASILNRPKQGFEAPLTAWWQGDLLGYARRVLLADGSACRRTFSDAGLEAALAPRLINMGGGRAAERLWILLCFEYWHRMYIDNACGKF